MKERERGKGQEEGGLLASRFSWWVLWGGWGSRGVAAPLKRTVRSMMALEKNRSGTFFDPSARFSAVLFQLIENLGAKAAQCLLGDKKRFVEFPLTMTCVSRTKRVVVGYG